MKRMCAVCGLLVCWIGFLVADSITVGTVSTIVAPARGLDAAQTWSSGMSLAQGDVVKNKGQYYMAEVAVVSSTNEPTHASGVVNNLRHFSSSPRKALILYNADNYTKIWFKTDGTAAVNSGWALAPGDSVVFSDYQHSFSAVAVSNSVTLGYDDINK